MALIGRTSPSAAQDRLLIRQRLSEVERRLDRLALGGSFRRGEVTAVDATMVTVAFADTAYEMPYADWYAPSVGDAVVVAVSAEGWFAMGTLA